MASRDHLARPSPSKDDAPGTEAGPAAFEARRLELNERLLDLFPALYLTMASIIQGVAFSYLVGVVHDHLGQLTWVLAVQSVAAVILIVAVWNLYAFGAFALIWHPTVFDGLIPFVYGAAEVLLCLSIDEDMARWLAFALMATFMGFITLVYFYRQGPRNSRNSGVFAVVMQGRRVNFLPLVSAFILAVLWALTETGSVSGSSPVAPVVVLVIFTGFLGNIGFHWRRFVRYLRGETVPS